ncbi:MAG: haloacid dehalogenase-like hydrolase [Acidobacteria bacterium]|nr:haloacid dehalogenase-like hydrolase [Acidobacteriota bacterium]
MIRHVILFDIDGTLISTGGAGRRAMERAFEKVHGLRGALRNFNLGGRIDGQIYAEIVARKHEPDRLHAYREAYFNFLCEGLGERPSRGKLLPGVVPLLERLADRHDTLVGLLTGNWREGARLKLEHYGIWRFFAFGAFGDDADERPRLPAVAKARARAVAPGGISDKLTRFFVIGDTPRDIECAQASGCIAVAVASGDYSRQALAGWTPHLLFDSLADTGRVCDRLFQDTGATEWNWTPIFDRFRKCEVF